MLPPILKYPRKSHRKTINYPLESPKLAEFLGIVFGDGGINNNWQLVISLNSISDLEYSKYLENLIKELFDIRVYSRKRPNQNTQVLVCSSTNLLDFLVSKGAVRGNKIKQKINLPDWIKDNKIYEKAFVRGLVDTDGCLYIHKHRIKSIPYKNIGFCFTSKSELLIKSVADILSVNGIKPYITDNNSRIYLYSAKSVVKYLSIFGSSNPRILKKYDEWRGV